MLEEAVAALKAGGEEAEDGAWSPQITIGTPVMIPERLRPDLQLRLGLYRRLADLDERRRHRCFRGRADRPLRALPEEVEHSSKIVASRRCAAAPMSRRSTPARRASSSPSVTTLFANPAGLVRWIAEQGSLAKVRPDQKVVFSATGGLGERLKGTAALMILLARIAARGRESGGVAGTTEARLGCAVTNPSRFGICRG